MKKQPIKHTRLYKTWLNMKNRCNNERTPRYKDYGGRGIKVCDEWNNSSRAFYEWAMENGYSDDLTIERIDNNKGYCPENCKWITKAEQNRNTRKCHLITWNGETHTAAEWGRMIGVGSQALFDRIDKLGWSIEKALTTPSMSPVHNFVDEAEIDGETHTLKEWSRRTGVPYSTIYSRYKRGVRGVLLIEKKSIRGKCPVLNEEQNQEEQEA